MSPFRRLRHRTFVVLALTVPVIAGSSVPASAAAGDLDPSFGGSGKVVTDQAGQYNWGTDVQLQTDGKIVVVGYLGTFQPDFTIARYNVDGTLDSSFGSGGLVQTYIPGDGIAESLAIQPDGKLVVAGTQDSSQNSDFAVARYLPDGTLDPAFGEGGIAVTNVLPVTFGSYDVAHAVALQADGKILVAGIAEVGDDPTGDFAIIRYNEDGSVDTGFSGDGRRTVGSGTNIDDVANDIAVQANGRIVVGGFSAPNYSTSRSTDFFIVRLRADGSLDGSFSGDGKLKTNFNDRNPDAATGVELQTDGKIVASGSTQPWTTTEPNTNFAIARYNTDGTLDDTFSGDGKRSLELGSPVDQARDLAIQTDGRILLVGESGDRFALARFKPGGGIDNGFSGDGIRLTGFGGTDSEAEAIVIQDNGRLVVAGWTFSSTVDVALARFLAA